MSYRVFGSFGDFAMTRPTRVPNHGQSGTGLWGFRTKRYSLPA